MKFIRHAAQALICLVASSSVFAEEKQHYGSYPAKYAEECSSCHTAYPPQKLTKAGWETQMSSLDQHYGTNASLDDATHKEILAYLLKNASTNAKNAPTEPTARITKTRWFAKEHGTNPPQGGSFSNCGACHTQADKGDYSERNIKIPASWNFDNEDDE